MKKIIAGFVSVVLMAGVANGAVIGFGDSYYLMPGFVTIDINLELIPGETVPGFGLEWKDEPGLTQVRTDPTTSLNQNQSINHDNYIAFNTPQGANPLVGPFDDIVAKVTLAYEPALVYELEFVHVSTSILLDTGSPMTYGPDLANVYPNMYKYGLGSPDASAPGLGSQDRNPLLIVTPEPGSLALLAFGGLALIRRR